MSTLWSGRIFSLPKIQPNLYILLVKFKWWPMQAPGSVPHRWRLWWPELISNSNLLFSFQDVEKMILGNKCDMEEKRVISKERGESIARENGVRFLETSAKTNVNIERAFMELSENILEKTPGISEPRPALPPVVNNRASSGCCSS